MLLSEALKQERVTLLDIGASLGAHSRWEPFQELMQVVGFEPNETEFNKLKHSANEKWIQAAVAGRSGRRILHLTKVFNNSSLLPPNRAVIDQLELGDGFDVVSELPLDYVNLDESTAVNAVRADFLKVDTQGKEFEILCGAERLLGCEFVMVEVEVEFCQLYEQQSLFADVDSRLREKGFCRYDLGNILYVKPRGMKREGAARTGRSIRPFSKHPFHAHFTNPNNSLTDAEHNV